MLSKIFAAAVSGIEAVPVVIETDIACGMPAFTVVGQPDVSVREARERIRSAVVNSGFSYPKTRIIINLSPADIRKRGSHFDFAMAMGILAASGQVFARDIGDFCFLGELSLDGSLQKTKGILPMVMAAKRAGIKNAAVPAGNRKEAMLVQDMNIYPVRNLKEAVDFFNRKTDIKYDTGGISSWKKPHYLCDFADVKGQEAAKRALMIAAAGGHGILMTGSPSTGKTMLAERIPTVMPEMTADEVLETTVIYSIAGLLPEDGPVVSSRPFRQPHHTITQVGLTGGGNDVPRPGEITLAHNGVLFLDEVGEFNKSMIDSLRTPLEKKNISLTRKGITYIFPADFMLVAATNPCKCGYAGDPFHPCTCTPREAEQYRNKLSGPILERIDMHLYLQPVAYSALTEEEGLSSAEMKEEIERTREIQRKRYRGTGIFLNQQLSGKMLEKYCALGKDENKLISDAYLRLNLNPRTLMRIKRVARTIADLSESECIGVSHLTEALQYREKRVY